MKEPSTYCNNRMLYIFRLGFPIAIQSAFLSLMGLVDSFMVSGLGDVPLSVVGVGARWLTFLSLLIFTLASAAQILLSQYSGANDRDGFHRVALLSNVHVTLVSVSIGAMVIAFPFMFMLLITNSKTILDNGSDYIQLMGGVILLTGLSVSVDTIFRSLGKTRIPLYAYCVEFGVNILFNYILIFGKIGFPELGIVGAGISSIIARSARTLILITILYRIEKIQLFSMHSLRCAIDPSINARFYAIAWPLIASAMAWTSGTFVMHAIIGRLGGGALAVMALVTPFELVAVSFISGVCCGASISIGHALGSGKIAFAVSLAKSAGYLSLLVGAGTATVFVTAAFLYLSHQTSLEPNTVSQIIALLPIMALSIMARTVTSTQLHGILKSGGDTKFCLWIDLISQWGIAIPSVAYFGIYLDCDLFTVYLIIQFEELLKIVPCQIRIMKEKWSINLVAHPA